MADETEVKKGWGFPALSRKAHYFVDGKSLCARWAFFGDLDDTANGVKPSPDDCAACRKKYDKTYGTSKPAAPAPAGTST